METSLTVFFAVAGVLALAVGVDAWRQGARAATAVSGRFDKWLSPDNDDLACGAVFDNAILTNADA